MIIKKETKVKECLVKSYPGERGRGGAGRGINIYVSNYRSAVSECHGEEDRRARRVSHLDL